MPEGPEIRRAADRIEAVVRGQKATDVFFAFGRLQSFADELRGRTVTRIETRGKAMLSWFDDECAVYSHNQLYGRWYVRKEPGLPKTNRQLRFAIYTEAGAAFLYSASQIAVLDKRGVKEHPFLMSLGPDLLDEEVNARSVRRRLALPEFKKRSLAALFLDQAFLAGVGNYLRSEILFCAGVCPTARPIDLDPEALNRTAKAAIQVTRRAYRTGGITVDAGTAKGLKQRGAPRRQYRHYVFSRVGRACRACGEPIGKVELAGRRLYFCRSCQA